MKFPSEVFLGLILISAFTITFNLKLTTAKTPTIYIREDGSVEPSTVPILNDGNIYYTLTDSIYWYNMVIQRDNIVVDGAGYTLRGYASGESVIEITNRINVSIKNMKIQNNRFGVSLESSLNISLSGNTITGISNGICLSSSTNVMLIGNNIEVGTGDWGVHLCNSNTSIISQNYIISKSYVGGLRNGIFLASSSNNIISTNTVVGCGIGVFVASSSGNIIYHNNFVNNTLQVYDYAWDNPGFSPSINVWNDGYPSGGNYWSDYINVDLCSGPYQNIGGSDGIGDTPYFIDENNSDNYPLMIPWIPGSHANLIVKTFGRGEIRGIKVWIDDDQPTYNSPVNMSVNMGIHTIKVSYGSIIDGPEEGSIFNYSFKCWEDGSTNNTRSLTLIGDKTIIAFYKWKIIYIW